MVRLNESNGQLKHRSITPSIHSITVLGITNIASPIEAHHAPNPLSYSSHVPHSIHHITATSVPFHLQSPTTWHLSTISLLLLLPRIHILLRPELRYSQYELPWDHRTVSLHQSPHDDLDCSNRVDYTHYRGNCVLPDTQRRSQQCTSESSDNHI